MKKVRKAMSMLLTVAMTVTNYPMSAWTQEVSTEIATEYSTEVAVTTDAVSEETSAQTVSLENVTEPIIESITQGATEDISQLSTEEIVQTTSLVENVGTEIINESRENNEDGTSEEQLVQNEETTVPEEMEASEQSTAEVIIEQETAGVAILADADTENNVNFTYNVLNGTYCQIVGYTGSETEITIPAEINGYVVQSISNSAFTKNKTLKKIVFPETIETIGAYAFYDCSELSEICLNEGLTNIAESAFSNCAKLTSIIIPESVTNLSKSVFSNCSSLIDVKLPSTLITIPESAFYGCSALEAIKLPDCIEEIGYQAFANCEKLSSINYPQNWKYAISSASYDSVNKNGCIFQNCKNLKKIEVPEGVTVIPSYAFNGCNDLEEVILPDTIIKIGQCAFYKCNSLKNINLPDQLKAIDSWAFCYSGIQLIEIPQTVTSMGNGIFSDCNSLESIVIPEGITELPSSMLSNCNSLTEVKIPQTVTSMGNYIFSGCVSLRSVVILGALTSISENTFFNCASLTDVVLPEGLSEIQDRAFSGCSGLVEIRLPDSIKRIGKEVFQGCTKLSSINYPLSLESKYYYDGIFSDCIALKKIEIPDGVTSIPDSAFYACKYLENVYLPDGLLTIGNNAFSGCYQLKAITIPETVTSIGSGVFYNCIGLEKIIIPEKVTQIPSSAFLGCNGLVNVKLPENLKAIGSSAFYNCTGLVTLKLPDGVEKIGDYAFANCTSLSDINYPLSWNEVLNANSGSIFDNCTSLKKIEIPQGVTEIPEGAFKNCTFLEKIVLPDTITSIGSSAFYNCTGLVTLKLPDGVEKIGHHAFANCTSLSDINYPLSWNEVLDANSGGIFYNCTSLKRIEIPQGVTEIPRGVFNGCNFLEKIILPDTLTTINAYVFEWCSSLKSITIPQSVTSIGTSAFSNCTSLREVTISDNVTELPSSLFVGCSGLSIIKLPKNLKVIRDSAFYGCSSLSEIILPDCVEEIGNQAFEYCTKLKKIEIPQNVTKVSKWIFRDCISLEKVMFPNAVTVIENMAFYNCSKLKEVILPKAVTSIGASAFYGCNKMERIWIGNAVSDIGQDTFSKCPLLTIYGNSGSYAENYAVTNEIPFSTESILNQTSFIKGKVVDTDKIGVEGVQVTLYDCTKGKVQESIFTDENGIWQCENAYVNHTYRITFYHKNYEIANTNEEYLIQEDGLVAAEVVAVAKKHVEETIASDFTYRILNGSYCELTGYKGKATEISIPSQIDGYTVQSIASCAFWYESNITTVILPDTIEKLGEKVFWDCSNLKEVRLSAGLVKINDYVFYNCTSLEKITLPGLIVELGRNAFFGCTNLKTVQLPEGLRFIQNGVFGSCSLLNEISLPNTVESIGYGAFANCNSLEDINYPLGLKNSGGDVFANCTNLRKIEIPEGVTSICDNAFSGCNTLEEISLPDTLIKIGNQTFYNCNMLREISLPNTLLEIGDGAFSNCTSLRQLVLPNSITVIGKNAFNNCIGLKTMTIPEKITNIASNMFSECSGLVAVNLPNGLFSIQEEAFSDCTGLTSIHLPDSVEEIGKKAFANCKRLSNINYPLNWKKTIGSSDYRGDRGQIFYGCKSLKKIEVPAGVTTIPAYAFNGCNYLEEIILPETVVIIDKGAFYNCGKIEEIILPSTVTTIGAYAFDSCSKMKRIWIGNTVSNIGNSAFGDCTMLTIHGMEGSYVQKYANDNSIPFSTDSIIYQISSIEGKVIDRNDVGVAGVTVTIYNATKCKVQERIVTDENGYWKSDDIYVGDTYRIQFYKIDYDILSSNNEYVIDENGVIASSAVAVERSDVEETNPNDFTYEILNGTYCKITGYEGTASTIHIPSKINGYIVQCIGEKAFYKNTNLEKVVFSDSIEEVGDKAFWGCSKLTEVLLNEGLTDIDSSAFENTGLKTITLPGTVVSLKDEAFYGCSDLMDISLNDGLEKIGWSVFRKCTNLKTIELPDTIQEIGGSAFTDCVCLNEVKLPKNLLTIGGNAFNNCGELTHIELPNSVEEIGYQAFRNCTKLSDINYPLNWKRSGEEVFLECASLRKIEVPEGVTAIPDFAFSGCNNLKEIVLPETLTSIGVSAFKNCTELINVNLPDSVEKIGDRAFQNCIGLSVIHYPLNWKAVIADSSYNKGEIFSGCINLKTIEVPEGVIEIPNYAFYGCGYLEKILLPKSLATIGNAAFYDCRALKEIEIPQNVTSMGAQTFGRCVSLEKVIILGSLTELNSSVFYSCTKLKNVVLPDSLLSIQQSAFAECSELTKINLPDSVEKIGDQAFANCTKLTEINYPLNWKQVIGSNGSIFIGCTNLKKIEVPEGVTEIPAYAFKGCGYLEEVVLPDTLLTIGESAFYNCTRLGSVKLPSGVVSVGSYAYYNCTGIRTITSSETLETIGSYAFYGCDGLVSLVLNDGLKKIANFAFSDCENLKAVEITRSVTEIGNGAFSSCPKLTIYCYSGSQAHMVSEKYGYRFYLLDEHEHEYITTVETSPTCTRGGSQILTCSICGYYYIDIMDALGHEYSNEIVPATCEKDGYTFHECLRCKKQYRDEIVPATGHNYGEWKIITKPGCVTDGYQKRICSVCAHEEGKVISAPGHIYENVVIAPTCTAQGCTVHTCTVCKNTYADQYVSALSHSFGDWTVTKNATILEEGLRVRTCSICGEEETEKITKLTVDIENNQQYGQANFTVLDALSVKPVSGASIFIKTENDGETTLVTDKKGKVSQILPVGQLNVAVYAEGYLVRNVKITVKSGKQDIAPIGISNKPLVDATITSKEMTYEEMIAAGIDVGNSENRHYYKYEVKIRFSETLDIVSLISYGDDQGNIFSTVSNTGTGISSTNKTVYAFSHKGTEVDAEPVTVVDSSKYGTYIAGRSNLTGAIWSSEVSDMVTLSNNGYYFEGYGIPSKLTVTSNRAFLNAGWIYNKDSGELSMSVGGRTHYLTFQDGTFCTVSNRSDAISISLFEKIPSTGYPTQADYVYVPADTFETGKQYLLVQFESKTKNQREALSHIADQADHKTVTIYGDDIYGEYIADRPLYENAVWTSSTAKTGGLKIANHYYFAQVANQILTYGPLADETGWKFENGYLTTKVDGTTFYLRYENGMYHVTKNEPYAGSVMLFEKTTVTDIVSSSGQVKKKIIYRRVDSFEEGKEYIIVGSGKNPSGYSGGNIGGSQGYGGSHGGGFSGTLSDGTPFTIYPVSEKFYLIIYGEVCWLKEMFDVEMLIVNNSSTDTIENCTAELILPEGLSLAKLVSGEQSAVQTVGKLETNESRSLHWYVRGDKEGSYNITATLSGTMMPFNEEFFYEYEVDSPIQVYAGKSMKMTFYIPEVAYNKKDYIIRIEIENVSNKVLYNVTHSITGWEQSKITYYRDGREEKEIYGSGGNLGSIGADAFYPGDKIVMEMNFDILFESSIIKNLTKFTDLSEQLYQAYQAVNTALDLIKLLTNFCSNVSKTLDKVSEGITDAKKREATKELLSAINMLYGKFEKGDSEALELASNVQSSELYGIIKSCSEAVGCEAFVKAETAETILEIANKIKCTIEADEKEQEKEKKFNIFDSLRTMVSNLPIQYVVDNIMISATEGSTKIPYSVVLTPAEAPYMGVDNWGKYLYNMTIASMGKISSPWYAQLFGAPDDITGYGDAVAYVKQVENQIAAYSVHKNSGTKFEAWIEKASSSPVATYAEGSANSGFVLKTDNETAAYVNGKLTFTGNAILEVTALSSEGGTLYIKDDEGNVRTIVITVVEPHTCHSDIWKVGVAPSKDHAGYRVKQCDVCQDIIAIENLIYCENHQFGEWITQKEATEQSIGIQYRECQKCGARETKYSSVKPSTDLVSVEIEWGNMDFTYTQGTWNTERHEYEEGEWNDQNSGYVKVINNGNENATAKVIFVSEQKEISGSFTDDENVITDTMNVEAGQSRSMHLELLGKPEQDLDNTKIGTVTIRIGGE